MQDIRLLCAEQGRDKLVGSLVGTVFMVSVFLFLFMFFFLWKPPDWQLVMQTWTQMQSCMRAEGSTCSCVELVGALVRADHARLLIRLRIGILMERPRVVQQVQRGLPATTQPASDSCLLTVNVMSSVLVS